MNRYPLPAIAEMTRSNRKIGLGIMGWADLLVELGIPYDSDEAIRLAHELMGFIQEEAVKASEELALDRGVFPNWEESIWKERGKRVRNATLTTIAPTGTISIIAGCSSGVEPIFALAFIRNVMDNTELPEAHPALERVLKERGLYSEDLMKGIAAVGGLHDMDVSDDLKRVFVTAHDVSPEWHIRMQAAFQDHVDNAVSKTVNFPNQARPEDVEQVYLLAHELRSKGDHLPRWVQAGAGAQHRRVNRKGSNGGQYTQMELGPQGPQSCRSGPAALLSCAARLGRSVPAVAASMSPSTKTISALASLRQHGKAGGCACFHRGNWTFDFARLPLRRLPTRLSSNSAASAATCHGLRAQPDPRVRTPSEKRWPEVSPRERQRRKAVGQLEMPIAFAQGLPRLRGAIERGVAWSAGLAATQVLGPIRRHILLAIFATTAAGPGLRFSSAIHSLVQARPRWADPYRAP